METVLDIDPELYDATARTTPAQQKNPGALVVELLRNTQGMPWARQEPPVAPTERRSGFSTFPERPGLKATVEQVRQFCGEEGI